MSPLKQDVLAGTEYPYVNGWTPAAISSIVESTHESFHPVSPLTPYDKDLHALLHTSDLASLVASRLSLEDILAATTLSNDHGIVQSCLEAGAQVTDQVQLKAQQGAELEVYHLLVLAGLDVNRDFDHIGSPISEAVISKDVERITFLLENGANRNIGGCLRRDSLMLALVDNLPLDAIKLLIRYGAEFPSKALLPLATIHGNVDVVDFLLENGAGLGEKIEEDICAAPGLTGTALDLSAERGYLDIVKLLLLRGADAGLVDSKGKTAADRAALAGQARALSITENWQP